MNELPLLPQHKALIDGSAISPEVATARGYQSIQRKTDLTTLGFSYPQARVPALLIPGYNPLGEMANYQIRPDMPRIGKTGKPIKYEMPKESGLFLDVNPLMRKYVGDPQMPAFVCEAIRKGDSGASQGLFCISILGVWNFRGVNDLGGRTALADWEYFALSGRDVYLTFDSDVRTNWKVAAALRRMKNFLEGRGSSVRILYLPMGEDGRKIGLDDYFAAGHTKQDLLALASDELPVFPEREGQEAKCPYQSRDTGLYFLKPTTEGPSAVQLTNFKAEILASVEEDDGIERHRVLEIRGSCQGVEKEFRLSDREFADTGLWPLKQLGAKAVSYVVPRGAEHTRNAIQMLSDAPEKTVYAHFGWRQIDGEWVFLHTGGGIGADGPVENVEVSPPTSLERFRLPEPTADEDTREAVRKSLGLLDIADRTQTLPLLAAVYSAPLGEVVSMDFVVWVYAPSGGRKSTAAALYQSHYGTFTRNTLPANFTSTANSNEILTFAAKNCLLVIDDYAPAPDLKSQRMQDFFVHRLLRSVGDNHGRNRATADGGLRGEKYPRCLPLVTAEMPPPGSQSSEARTLEVEWNGDSVDLARLTQAQADSASYPLAMVGYLKWLAPQIETLKETVPPLLRKLASSLPAQHGRVQENAAKLLIGMNLFLAYAEEIGAVTGEERTALFREATRAFSEKAYVTGQKQAEKKPTNLFKDVLLNLIHQGEGYLACATTNSLPSQPKLYGYGDFSTQEEEIYRPREGAKQFGWVDEAEGIVYLIPEEVYQQTFDFTRRSGGMFPVQKHGFGSYLKQEKVLARWNDNRNDYRKRLGGRNRNVWALKKSFLFPNDSDEDNGSIEPTPTPADLIDLFSPSPNEAMSQPEEAFEHPAEVTENLSGESKVHIIKGASAIGAALNDLTAAPLIGLDLETTGLDPRKDKTRLLTLSSARNTYVLDCFETDPTPFFPVMSAPSTRLIGQNLAFDLSFLTGDGFEPGRVEDTMLLSQLLHSGLTFETKDGDDKLSKLNHGLAEIVKRELGLDLSKEEQKSDWSGRLSRSQLDYAAKDASILQPLYRKLREKIAVAGLEKAAEIERRCLPAMVWMRNAGVGFDWDGWRTLAEETEAEALRIAEEMDQIAPMPPGLDLGFGWQWDKNQIVQRVFKELGFDLHNTNDETLAGIDHPLADLLRKYRGLKIRMNAYGLNWEPYVEDGRIYSDWKQIGADSGRMASRDPNLQQVPGALKHPQYRKCLVAPPGRMLVKADYSQIELRIAAKIANERAMIAAYEQGEDLHILTARRLTGKDEITKEDRQIAKSANFGLLYGMAAEGYRIYAQTNYNVALSPEEAAAYRNAFFTGYPGLLKWHRSVRSSNSTETRTLAGRRRLLNEQTPYTHRLNTPVQGTGADGLKRALALLWERRDQCEGTFPVMAVHDEIVVECDEGQVAAAGEWLKTAMHDGMRALIAPVPVEVEVSAGRTWAGS